EGVSVRRGARDQLVGDAGAGARLVLDDELLVEAAPELLGQDTQRDVAGPARPVGRHQPHDPRRPIALGKRRKVRSCGEAGGDGPQQGSASDFHECLPGKKSRLEWRLVRPVSSGRVWRDRIAESPGLRLIEANDRDALSIEQCVFFDRLISFVYKFRNTGGATWLWT